MLLELVGQDYTLKGSGRWYHSLEHDSLVVDAEKDIFYWNSKHLVGDSYIWLTTVKGLSHQEAKEFLYSHKETFSFISSSNKAGDEVVIYPKLVEIFYENGKNNRDYWYRRKLTDDTISRFRLGYTGDGWYTIPITQDGVFKNFQCRMDIPEKRVKSWYKGFHPILFNSDLLKFVDYVYITEGPTDCLVLNQWGLPAISHNGGSGCWQDEWFKYFIPLQKIYIVYDNDQAGVEGAKQLARHLGMYKTHIYTFTGFSDKYDVGDFIKEGYSREDFVSLVNKESRLCFEIGS